MLAATTVLVAVATLVPLSPGPGWQPRSLGVCLFCGELGGLDALNNVLLYVPFGAAAAALGWSWRRALVAAALLSGGSEFIQYAGLSGRYAGIGDVVFNTLGALSGSALFITRRAWMAPSIAGARVAAITAAAGFVAAAAATSWMLGLAIPASPLSAQWVPRRAVPFTGALHAAALNGHVLSAGPLPSRTEEDFQSRARRRQTTLAADITPAVNAPAGFAPIVRVVTDERVHLALGQAGEAIVFIPTLRSRDIGFRTLAVRGPAVAATLDRVHASGSAAPRYLDVTIRTDTAAPFSRRLDLTVGLAWATLLPVTLPLGDWPWIASAVWLLLLAGPVGFYTAAAAASRGPWRWLPPATLASGLALVPWAAGIALSGWTEWAGAVTGVALGVVVSVSPCRARFVHRGVANMDGRSAPRGPAPDRPLHVLQMGAIPPPYGGVQVHLMAIRALLQRLGHRASAINLTGHRQPDRDDLFFPRSAPGVLRLIARLWPDIIHLHIGGHLPWRLLALAAICSCWPGIRTVLTFHSGGYPSSDEGRRLSRHSLKARILQRFDRVIAVNDELGAFLVRCGVPEDRVSVISPYASERPHTGTLPDTLERFLSAHSPLLVTIGLLEPEYDLGLQIDLVGDLVETAPRAGLVILGSGSLAAELGARLDRTPWREHVLLYGDLVHDRTLAVLRRADVFLRTTRYDGDALSVREALTLGVPVVATRTALRPPGPRLVAIGDRPGLLVAIGDALRDRAAQGSRDSAAADIDIRHDTDNIAAIVRLYEDVLGGPVGRGIRETSPA